MTDVIDDAAAALALPRADIERHLASAMRPDPLTARVFERRTSRGRAEYFWHCQACAATQQLPWARLRLTSEMDASIHNGRAHGDATLATVRGMNDMMLMAGGDCAVHGPQEGALIGGLVLPFPVHVIATKIAEGAVTCPQLVAPPKPADRAELIAIGFAYGTLGEAAPCGRPLLPQIQLEFPAAALEDAS